MADCKGKLWREVGFGEFSLSQLLEIVELCYREEKGFFASSE